MNMQSSFTPAHGNTQMLASGAKANSPWQQKVPTGIARPALYGALVALAFCRRLWRVGRHGAH